MNLHNCLLFGPGIVMIIGRNGGGMTPAAVERELRRGAGDVGKPGNDDTHGGGRVNAANAVR